MPGMFTDNGFNNAKVCLALFYILDYTMELYGTVVIMIPRIV